MFSRRNEPLTWNLSAVATAIGALLYVWSPPLDSPDSNIGKGTASSAAADESIDPFLPTNSGIVSFPTGIWEDPFRYRRQALAALQAQECSPADSAHYTEVFQPYERSFAHSLMVLPVIVMGEDHGSDAVERTQHRHAVENALSGQGFFMKFPSRMSYVLVKSLTVRSSGTDSKINGALPLKFYASDNGQQGVLVFWVDRRWLGQRPIDVLNQLIDKTIGWGFLASGGELSIVGPTYSEDLEQLFQDDTRFRRAGCRGLPNLYSPTATAFRPDEKALGSAPFRFVSAIGTDESLVGLLVDELNRRRLLGGKVVLFTEAGYDSPKKLTRNFRNEQSDIIQVPFLSRLTTKGGSLASSEASRVHDYFARKMRSLTRQNGGSSVSHLQVTLVGVFANDVNDKLLILNAARSTFPNARLFAMDMNAQFTLPEHLPYTRNLLVASHYGLNIRLGPALIDAGGDATAEPISFRDTYQTAEFLATSIAVSEFAGRRNPKNLCLWEDNGVLRPLMFEIGADGAHQLRMSSRPSSNDIAQNATRRTASAGIQTLAAGLLVLAGVIVLCTLASRPALQGPGLWPGGTGFDLGLEVALAAFATLVFWSNPGNPSAWVFAGYFVPGVAVILLAVWWLRRREESTGNIWIWIAGGCLLLLFSMAGDYLLHGEPWSILSGISVWPSVLMMAAVCCGATVWLQAFQRKFPWQYDSDAAFCELGREAPPGNGAAHHILLQLYRVTEDHSFAFWAAKPLVRARLISATLLTTLLLVSMVLGNPIAPPPARGTFSLLVAFFFQVLVVLLLFLVVSHSLIQTLALRGVLALHREALQRRLAQWRSGAAASPTAEDSEGLLVLARWVERATRGSAKGIWAPACLLLVYTIARLPFWDGWHVNGTLAWFIVVPLTLTILFAGWLRRDAQALRDECLDLLREMKRAVLKRTAEPQSELLLIKPAADRHEPATVELMTNIEDEIAALKGGAFSNILHDPVLGSFLLLITSAVAGPGRELVTILRSIAGIA